MGYSEWGNLFGEPELLEALKADPLVYGIKVTAGKFFIALELPTGREPQVKWAEDNLNEMFGVSVTLCAPESPAYLHATHSLYDRQF